MNIEFKINDLTITGEASKVQEMLQKLGLSDEFYTSASHGPLLIANMHDAHIRNALRQKLGTLKIYLGEKGFREFLGLARENEKRLGSCSLVELIQQVNETA